MFFFTPRKCIFDGVKKCILIMVFLLCSAVFAGEANGVAVEYIDAAKDVADLESASVVLDSAMAADSARYYEDKAIDLKLDGDYLRSTGLGSIIGGSVIAALGMAGMVYGGMFFLEGGLGVMLSLFILPPAAGVAALGVTSMIDGFSSRSEGKELYRQSEEMYKKSDRFRAHKQQVKVDVVPLINPLTGMAGMNVTLRF